MKKIITLLTIVLSLSQVQAQDASTFFTDANMFFKENTRTGVVSYKKVKMDPTGLHSLLTQIGSMDVSSLNANEEKAFYINAYNVFVIAGIVKKYPVASPMDITNFFDNKSHKLSGTSVSLNELEKEILFVKYPDARLHFALVCGAQGCPVIQSEAFLPTTLEAQLEKVTRTAVQDVEFTQYNKRKNKVKLSKIFEWYAKDFGMVNEFLYTYSDTMIPLDVKISYYDYDWSLNE